MSFIRSTISRQRLPLSIILGPMDPAKFLLWGWRIPFLISIFLVGAAVYIRLQLEESPLYTDAKAQGRTRGNPLYDSFFKPYNLYYVCLSLFGATMGQGVVWYTAQFTSLTFLTGTLKLQFIDAYCAVGAALLLGAPLFVLVGHLSDSYGRKPFMVAGLFLGCALFYPIFMGSCFFNFRFISLRPIH
jgi:MFS family permease